MIYDKLDNYVDDSNRPQDDRSNVVKDTKVDLIDHFTTDEVCSLYLIYNHYYSCKTGSMLDFFAKRCDFRYLIRRTCRLDDVKQQGKS